MGEDNESRYVSTTQVAAALGVSVTTVKRWVDEGILPAHKTPGGHRKLLLTDVLRVARSGKFPHVDLSRLEVQADGRRAPDPAPLSRRLLDALREGNTARSRTLLREAYQGGMSPARMSDTVIAPVMCDIGRAWEMGEIDVFHEHRSTLTCSAALQSVKTLLEDGDDPKPLAIGGGPEGDPYLLANLLAEMVLLDAGWRVINLGPNTPLASFRKALLEYQPRLLWLSVSFLVDPIRFVAEYQDLYQQAQHQGTAVVLGGQAITSDLRSVLPCEKRGESMAQLAEFAQQLHPLPSRPARGRPRNRRSEKT